MRKRTLKNLLSFLLVLVLTVCTVATLSMVTQAKTDPTLPVVEKTIPATELSASISHSLVASPLVCVGGFLLVLVIVVFGLTMYRRDKRRGKETPQGKRSYIPRADMSFAGKNRV